MNKRMLVEKNEQNKKWTLSQKHGIEVPPGKILSHFFSYSGLSLNICAKSQMGQTGKKTKDWYIWKEILKSSDFHGYCNRTAYLYLCVDKTEGVHHEPRGIYTLHSFLFSWRMIFFFLQMGMQEEENGK